MITTIRTNQRLVIQSKQYLSGLCVALWVFSLEFMNAMKSVRRRPLPPVIAVPNASIALFNAHQPTRFTNRGVDLYQSRKVHELYRRCSQCRLILTDIYGFSPSVVSREGDGGVVQ